MSSSTKTDLPPQATLSRGRAGAADLKARPNSIFPKGHLTDCHAWVILARLAHQAQRRIGGISLPQSKLSLTDNEATLLALVARGEPITAYQIAKIYEGSPVSNFNTSPGKIYPIIKRLKEAAYLEGRPVEGDARGTEQILTTEEGKEALRAWIMEIRSAHLLPEDPLRTKVQSFDLLTREERIEWISRLKIELLEKLDRVEEYGREKWAPYQGLVHENAVKSIRSRMDWLDRVLSRVVSEKD